MAGTWARRVKRRLVAMVARASKRPKLTAMELGTLSPDCISIIRQHNQMGDMVCALPALRALKEKFPKAKLTLITSPVNGAVVQHNPDLDRVLTFSQKMWRRPWELARFVRELRNPRSELAFVLGSVSFSITSTAIAVACGARWIVGPDSLPYGWDVSRHVFALEMPASPVIGCHAVEHGLAPLRAIGIETGDSLPVMRPAPAERQRAHSVMENLGLAESFWVLHPGAGKAQNVWPAERFAAIAVQAAELGKQILVLSGPADKPYLADFRSALSGVWGSGPVGRILFAPPLSVGVGAALLERAERFLCNDTGMMHVAGAVGTPTLALFGPTDPALWKPPSPLVVALCSEHQNTDPRGPEFGWMENLSVEAVWKAWLGLPLRSEMESSSTNEWS